MHVRTSAVREWLYVRNPIDPRRVSGVMIDHETRVLVTYEESDLRNARGIRGWLDVLALGLDPDTLEVDDAIGAHTPPVSVRWIRFSVDAALLAWPTARLPNYREIAYADWLEGLGEH